MKKTKFFFWRLDIPKKICLIGIVPLLYVTFWTWIGMRLGFLLVPLSILAFIVCLIPVRVPDEKAIKTMLSACYEEHHIHILDKVDKGSKKDLVFFKGFSSKHATYKRKTDSGFVFPVCRTLAFSFKDNKAIVYLRDSALWENAKCENDTFEILRGAPARVTRLSYKEGTNVNLFAFYIGEKTFKFYIQNRFEMKEILEAHKDFFVIDAN